MNLEEARGQLLHQIELQLRQIYKEGSEAPHKLSEFYDYVAELPVSQHLFIWYLMN